jgi:hypothetical protein
MQKIINKNGQGAIEYLLLIGAVILVVAVVISYMTGVLDFGQKSGDKALYDSMCLPRTSGGMDTNSLLCGCYLKDDKKGEYVNGNYKPANAENCPEALDPRYKNDTLLIR